MQVGVAQRTVQGRRLFAENETTSQRQKKLLLNTGGGAVSTRERTNRGRKGKPPSPRIGVPKKKGENRRQGDGQSDSKRRAKGGWKQEQL